MAKKKKKFDKDLLETTHFFLAFAMISLAVADGANMLRQVACSIMGFVMLHHTLKERKKR